MLGSAIATSISDIPFDGPCATTQVGLIDGEFVINPTSAQKKVSDLALTVASTREKVIMIEAGANEVPEQTMIDAIFKAHEVNQEIIRFIDRIVADPLFPLTREEIEEQMDPALYVGRAPEQVTEFLDGPAAELLARYPDEDIHAELSV